MSQTATYPIPGVPNGQVKIINTGSVLYLEIDGAPYGATAIYHDNQGGAYVYNGAFAAVYDAVTNGMIPPPPTI